MLSQMFALNPSPCPTFSFLVLCPFKHAVLKVARLGTDLTPVSPLMFLPAALGHLIP